MKGGPTVVVPHEGGPLRVALLGCGVVGTEVVRLLTTQAEDLAARVGAPLELVGIVVRDLRVEFDPVVDRALLTADAEGLVERADVVIEVMGGIEPARSLLLRAIAAGASVVTANKALLAEDGPTLYRAADEAGVDLYFEAAVAGAIPIVRPVRESLAGDRVRRVLGIVNGTTNYVLDRMATEGLDLDIAVKEAQQLGFAEADPTADIVSVLAPPDGPAAASSIVTDELKLLGHKTVRQEPAEDSQEGTVVYFRQEAQKNCAALLQQVPELQHAALQMNDEIPARYNAPIVIAVGTSFVTPDLTAIYGRLLNKAAAGATLGTPVRSFF